jgi:4-aminobutyrate aminotransferase-like enzyme
MQGEDRGVLTECAIEFAGGALRDAVQEQACQDGLMILACGPAGLRFRPPLDTTAAEVDEALAMIKKAVEKTPKP